MFDNSWVIFLNSLLYKNQFFDALVYFVANVLPFLLFLIVLIYFIFIRKNILKLATTTLIILASWGLSEILKFLFHQDRPFLIIPEVIPLFTLGGADSFPSGHATVFAALAVAMYFENKKLGTFFIFSAFLIGLARIISGVHFPQDILAGFLIGAVCVIICFAYIRKLRNN